MLLSFALIFLVGITLGRIFEVIKLPKLIGMLLTGVLLGPYVWNLIDPTVLEISTDLRQIALIIILTRAGLNLNIDDLKKVGRPAILMCFVPATLEIIGMMLLAPRFLGVTLLEAAVMGTVVAAVSPAVIVPKMLVLMEEGYGTKKSIPQMVLAGASVDDVYVIVLFTAFVELLKGGTIQARDFLAIPSAIIFGIIGGVIVGLELIYLFKRVSMRDTTKVAVILSVSFILVALEQALNGIMGFSGLLAIMALGVTIHQNNVDTAQRLSNKFSKLWVGAEVFLFVLVGATVNISYAFKAGTAAILLILAVLIFRTVGVFISLIGTNLNKKERVFTAFSYMPKATVQAAIGGLPLAMGLASGELILTVAVVAIMVTAPLGAILVDSTYKKFLKQE
ncbi:hypothetical protein BW727_100166 [Jeotgalibaca dankookensis]|uniref:Cation/H+ exchanger transmembrane domain-containing protein n=1 Tax=Jeotgalibaca dankookensis TaxID=708126 RepID=A0A1S6IM18_9LACT|nr:cation:proton antiporter [Jeotgalibaca dankookensis]AQS52576.1 hypothetical protein BW727_100166 [Jeotgalibaca dankookensis]